MFDTKYLKEDRENISVAIEIIGKTAQYIEKENEQEEFLFLEQNKTERSHMFFSHFCNTFYFK